MNNGGDTAVVWTRFDGTNNIFQVSLRTGTGGTFETPLDLSDPGQDAFEPAVAVDDAIVIWSRSDGTNSIVQAAVAAGIPPTTPPTTAPPGAGVTVTPTFTG